MLQPDFEFVKTLEFLNFEVELHFKKSFFTGPIKLSAMNFNRKLCFNIKYWELNPNISSA
ncbi:hypothetical protein Lepto782_08860 [Leptospira interrogans serovar Canicola]|uniref:Uncharacterized protein n=1 Tax=Leptospira interrogans serovar Canicola TaxID=211880 RepID=A0AAP9WEN0_LEPIR|nr:hypothetical protein Lepto782_08860 [Leptospira interrogans serovar Canicola]